MHPIVTGMTSIGMNLMIIRMGLIFWVPKTGVAGAETRGLSGGMSPKTGCLSRLWLRQAGSVTSPPQNLTRSTDCCPLLSGVPFGESGDNWLAATRYLVSFLNIYHIHRCWMYSGGCGVHGIKNEMGSSDRRREGLFVAEG